MWTLMTSADVSRLAIYGVLNHGVVFTPPLGNVKVKTAVHRKADNKNNCLPLLVRVQTKVKSNNHNHFNQ